MVPSFSGSTGQGADYLRSLPGYIGTKDVDDVVMVRGGGGGIIFFKKVGGRIEDESDGD